MAFCTLMSEERRPMLPHRVPVVVLVQKGPS